MRDPMDEAPSKEEMHERMQEMLSGIRKSLDVPTSTGLRASYSGRAPRETIVDPRPEASDPEPRMR